MVSLVCEGGEDGGGEGGGGEGGSSEGGGGGEGVGGGDDCGYDGLTGKSGTYPMIEPCN